MTILILTILICATVFWAISPLQKRFIQANEISALQNDKRRKSRQNQELKREIRRLRDDPQYIELLARRELGLIKSDEKAYIVTEPDVEHLREHKESPPQPQNLWQLIEDILTKKLRF